LSIFSNRLIREVQEDFTNAFPFLKIEFFKKGDPFQKIRHGSPNPIFSNRTLREAWSSFKEEGFMEVTEEMSVRELELIFLERFGLTTYVFRKSGNLWLETSMTENWTLKQQNDHGMEISSHFLRN